MIFIPETSVGEFQVLDGIRTASEITGPKSCKTRAFNCSHADEVQAFTEVVNRHGGFVCAVLKVPFWNNAGQNAGGQYAIIYQAGRDFSIPVRT